MHLSGFDIDGFLSDIWQQRPLLIRNPWNHWGNPLRPDDLAGLACEPEVESRLVVKSGDSWKLENGPLPAERFGELGGDPWTLLVQAVDHHVPEVAALLECFRFIPNWRVDDVMVSYAEDGGGVGPHFDNYDVFLVQGLGRRRWRIGARCDAATELLPHPDLRLLAQFEALEEWVLEPGDMLYVPPGIAHDGVAVGDDCMTYSIGFRAPSRGELIAGWAQSLLAEMGEQGEDDRYRDPDLGLQDNPGEITPDAIADLHAMVAEKLSDRAGFARWFGRYATAPKNPEIDWQPEQPVDRDEIERMLAEGIPLLRNPATRFAFVREGPGALMLYVDGEGFECHGDAAQFAEQLCAKDRLSVEPELANADAVIDLLADLADQGSVAFDTNG